MCGINGIFAFHSASNPPEEAELLATRDAMRNRGPDGSGVWWSSNRRCGLGHQRLAIVDLSERASQPMTSVDGANVVVFNGEIYNYPHLRLRLEDEGVRFTTTSDTEVLLHLYGRYGQEMVRWLRGMYAFGIWDTQRNGLFLARDPYGIKPLYTAHDGWTFRFASQVKALVAGGRISHEPEPAGIVGFHLFGSVPEPFTLYREIRALPAGHTQWIDSSGPCEPTSFSNIAKVLANGASNPVSPKELPERLRASVLDSVRAHLLADVEIGVFLSAGVDSSAILGLTKDAGQNEIRAITLSFEEFRGTAEDETSTAKHLSECYRARHIVRNVGKKEFIEDLPMILGAMDQPSTDGVNSWFISKAAKEVGLKVALSGLGGDELLGGYPSFQNLPSWRRRFGPLASVPGLGFVVRKSIKSLFGDFSRRRPKALGLLEYSDSWPGVYLLRRGLFLPHELPGLMDPEVARQGLLRLKPLQLVSECLIPDPRSDNGRVCVLESAHYLRNQLLRDADWAGMAHGVEIRVPMVDITLLKALASSIPSLTRGSGKTALAKAPLTPLPDQVAGRKKMNFRVPTKVWMDMLPPTGNHLKTRLAENEGLVSRRWSATALHSTLLISQVQSPHSQ